MAKSLVSDQNTVVTHVILVDGQQIPGHFGVVEIKVVREINKIPYARIKLTDGGVAEADDFEIGNSSNFEPGKEITIKAGYQSTDEDIFKGIVIKHGISIDHLGAFLIIECKHIAVKMTIGRKNDIFLEKKDSEVINSIIQTYAINKEVENTSNVHPEIVQHYVSDWDFVLMRADINGLIVIPELDKLSIKAPNLTAAPVYDAAYGTSLISFQADIDARAQLKSVEGYSWDYSKQEVINAKGNATKDNHAGNFKSSKLADAIGLDSFIIQTSAFKSVPVLDTITTAKLTKAQLGFMKGTLKIQGVADINPGDWLNITGLSDRFNGKVFIGGVMHRIDRTGWITECIIGISNDWYVNETPGINAPSASGFIPPFKGLSTAVVQKIHEDPDGNYRVQVTIPTLQKDNLKLWARLSNLYASNESGTFFYPEINDEVIVGFLNEDPQHPIILGKLYSKINKAPLEPADQNPEKAIITREKLTIHFNDEKKIITIHTPGENSITIDDEAQKIVILDQHKNNIEMSDAGISSQVIRRLN